MDYEAIVTEIQANLQASTPYKSGNLKASTRLLSSYGDTWAIIKIDTPYASFVNYGALEHPNSAKLNKDYMYVENSLRNSLKILVERYGGGRVI